MILPEFDLSKNEQVWIGDLTVEQKEELIGLVEEKYGNVRYKDDYKIEDATSLNHDHEDFSLHHFETPEAFKHWSDLGTYTTIGLPLKPSRTIDLSNLI